MLWKDNGKIPHYSSMPHTNEEIINNKKRKFIMDGIINDMVFSTEEIPKYTFLGSTDRKSYTLKSVLKWLDERSECYTEIQPYQTLEEVKFILVKIEEESKYKFANMIYEKYYHLNH